MPGFVTNDFYLYDDTDTTKQLRFDTSALTTANLVTLVVPAYGISASLTLALQEAANTFTNTNIFNGGTTFNASWLATVPCGIAGTTDNVQFFLRQNGGGQTADMFQLTNGSGATKYFKLNYRGDHVDTFFYTCASGDATARFKFDASGITTATDRTLTVPDASGSVLLREIAVCYNDDVVCYDDEIVTSV